MYFRFRRRVPASKPSRSPSDAAGDVSSGDSSSNQAPSRKGKGRLVAASDASDDDDGYVVFEFTGHPYFPPEEALQNGDFDPIAEDDTEEATKKEREKEKKKEKGSPKKPKVAAGKPGELQCFFCSCRIYPTKNISMLDSFLELKVENERLRLMLKQMNMQDNDPDFDKQEGQNAAYHPNLIQAELEMALQEGNTLSSHAMLPMDFPGARYGSDMGSISRGFSNGSLATLPLSPKGTDSNAAGDDGSDGEGSNAGDERRKKKKPKADEGDYVCTDCGRVDSPEWRKGPLGPKTLCNACGLRWAKRVKRKGGDPNAAASAFQQAARVNSSSGGAGSPPLGSPTLGQMDGMNGQNGSSGGGGGQSMHAQFSNGTPF